MLLFRLPYVEIACDICYNYSKYNALWGDTMRVKSNGILCLLCTAMLLLCAACSDNSDAVSCTLTVVSEFSGYGVDGQNLGSGSFTETFSVTTNDALYEEASGHWRQNGEKSTEPMLTVKAIDENGVTLISGTQEITLGYGASKTIQSQRIVYDGQNYVYTISFAKAAESNSK